LYRRSRVFLLTHTVVSSGLVKLSSVTLYGDNEAI
jgi:hypothetical protein